MNPYIFKTGPLEFQIDAPDIFPMNRNLMKFKCTDIDPQYFYTIHVTNDLPALTGKLVEEDPFFDIYEECNLEQRSLSFTPDKMAYAHYVEADETHADIYVPYYMLDNLKFDNLFCSAFALERKALLNNSLIFHCAFMEKDNTAILFSGPSGIGKSTQADLWKLHRGTAIINGDRSLLHYDEHSRKCYAHGWPVCGSSEICENNSLPVKAIVFLEKGTDNIIEKLSFSRALRYLYEQITTNRWNKNFIEQSLDLCTNIIAHTPILHLTCTPDISAVECLEDFIQIL